MAGRDQRGQEWRLDGRGATWFWGSGKRSGISGRGGTLSPVNILEATGLYTVAVNPMSHFTSVKRNWELI